MLAKINNSMSVGVVLAAEDDYGNDRSHISSQNKLQSKLIVKLQNIQNGNKVVPKSTF